MKLSIYLKKITIISMIMLFLSNVFGGEGGKNGFAFLKVDVDARSAGMGGAYTAIAENAGAAYWNPAGLGYAKEKSLIVMHNQWLVDITQQFAAVQFRTGQNAFALSFNLMTIPGVEIRDDVPTDQPLGKTEVINLAGGLSYARTFENDWRAGVTVKYLYEKLYMESAAGWALDFGVRKNFSETIFWGLTMQNLGSMKTLLKESTPLPVILRTGVGYRLPYKITGKKPLLSSDIQYNHNEQYLLRLGAQVDLGEYLALRTGAILGSIDANFTTGFSLFYKAFSLDYAFVPFGLDLGDSHRISFQMFF